MSLLKEFKEFAVKGNVVDMAVGVIVGAAFGKIVSSLVADVIMPPLGLVVGGIDFKGFELVLKESVGAAPAVALKYGAFIQSVFDFTIQALAIFAAVKAINTLRRAEDKPATAPVTPPPPSNEARLLGEIRDLLKAQQGR